MPALISNRLGQWFGRRATSGVARRFGIVALGGLLPCLPLACNAPGYTTGNKPPNPNQRPGANVDPNVQVYTDGPVGWASVNDLGQDGTTGGGDATPVTVMTLADFTTAVSGTTPGVIQLAAPIMGSVKVGSNKTILGVPGIALTGHLGIDGQSNVIVRDFTVIGYNCVDNADCQSGADAVTIDRGSHHIWIDHCDISDGSDGDLDVASAADYVTISWTKFWYSGFRPGDHQFANLIGSSDQSTGDKGHLRVTWHHDWWAQGVGERMPRARYGEIHLFNNLYTSVPSAYCVGLGVNANFLIEDVVFDGVSKAFNTNDFSNAQSVLVSFAVLFEDGTYPAGDVGTAVFTPPYDYTLEPAENVKMTVMANVGPSMH
jgi:pectate lyase